jgi:hypothetical protein
VLAAHIDAGVKDTVLISQRHSIVEAETTKLMWCPVNGPSKPAAWAVLAAHGLGQTLSTLPSRGIAFLKRIASTLIFSTGTLGHQQVSHSPSV